MKKRGPIITISGIVLIVVSLSIAVSTVPSNVTGPDDFSVSSLFEGMFDEISNEIQIMPDDSAHFSYTTYSSDVPLLWGIQILDYQDGDKLSIIISNIFGDSYGTFVQDEPILFEVLQISQSDTLNLEIQNLGERSVTVVAMFSEDPENSESLTNPNSPVMNMVLPLMISGFLLVLGIIVLIVGIIVILVDLKNNLDNKRNY
ncbi:MULTISPECIES: hypothetical protein [Nitrosopumilus]|uniref:Uncharacterized protein n=1 Tax=Nitrosopumilus piranensis TaxID=1582439 RepID=A0A0C5BXF2_9ARCH|nr:MULTISPECIES: hypothetical protein [Nitrosopumilus]AJM92986.1 conserved exported protein of unknown function [Nitrosopumilus piranensis]KAF6244806.1 hypothetical protein C6989_06260 [Nitrosopumilus sp. b2]